MQKLKQLMALVLSLGLFISLSMVAVGCGTSGDDDDDDDNNDDNDDSTVECELEGDGCEEGCLTVLLEDGSIDGTVGDGLVAADLANECIATGGDVACVGHSAKLAIDGLTLVDEVGGLITTITGFLKQGDLTPQQGADMVESLLSGFIDPIYDVAGEIDASSEGMLANGCSWGVANGVPIQLGDSPSGDIYIEATVKGNWGDVEASFAGAGAKMLMALIDFLMSHSLSLDIASVTGGDFGSFDYFPKNIPAALDGVDWLFLDNPDLLKLKEDNSFAALPGMLSAAADLVLDVVTPTDGLAFADRSDFVIFLVDANANGVIDAGDSIGANVDVANVNGDTSIGAGPHDYEIPAEIDATVHPAVYDLLVAVSANLSAGGVDCGANPGDCITIDTFSELTTILEPILEEEINLPNVIALDLGAFFNGVGLRDIILYDDVEGIVAEGEWFGSCSDEGAPFDVATCDEATYSNGALVVPVATADNPHFNRISEGIAADNIVPPADGGYVMPYIRLGSCTINDMIWTDLSGFEGWTGSELDTTNYAEVTTGFRSDATCYDLMKLLAIAMLETGVLEEE